MTSKSATKADELLPLNIFYSHIISTHLLVEQQTKSGFHSVYIWVIFITAAQSDGALSKISNDSQLL